MRFLFCMLFFVSISCQNQISESFIGTWRKDSSTNGPTTRLSKPYVSGTLIFGKDSIYSYSWIADDVLGDDRGRYFIIASGNGLKILRLEKAPGYYSDYIILEKTNHRFKVKSRHSYNVSDSTIYFDMVDVYKKN